MTPLTAQRTLVKSPPELWSELSEVDRLARHLEAFGEIKITKLEPEHTVAWEGEHACGTVSIEPSGWGTKVTLEAALALEPEAEPVAPEPEPEPVAPEPQPEAEAEPVAVDPDPEPVAPEPRPEPTAEATEPQPPDSAEPEPAPRKGFWARLIGRWLLPEERVNQLAREEERRRSWRPRTRPSPRRNLPCPSRSRSRSRSQSLPPRPNPSTRRPSPPPRSRPRSLRPYSTRRSTRSAPRTTGRSRAASSHPLGARISGCGAAPAGSLAPAGTMSPTTRRSFLQAAGASAALAACGGSVRSRPEDGPNVLVIIVDSLRADHVFGDRARTPNMDELMRAGLSFTRTYPEAMPTVPARNSILAGRRMFPFRNWRDRPGLLDSPGGRPSPASTTPSPACSGAPDGGPGT